MLADYVMKGIDSLFSQKLITQEEVQTVLRATNVRSTFNKATIKKSLKSIIKKGEGNRSPSENSRQPSPISKSRLKIILENNKDERLRSVVKRNENCQRETSPYSKIEVFTQGRLQREQRENDVVNKENNVIKYYRNARKSTQKVNLQKSVLKNGKKSRIFGSSVLSRSISNVDLRHQPN